MGNDQSRPAKVSLVNRRSRHRKVSLGNRHSRHKKVSTAVAGRAVMQSHIRASQAQLIIIPLTREDQHGKKLNTKKSHTKMDRKILIAALHHVANQIVRNGGHVTIVAVGGAVNTLHLQSRAETHDVDVFGTCADNYDRVLLNEAIHDAQVHCHNLGQQWLNSCTQKHLNRPLHHAITLGALKQNVKIFEAPGLTVYAAPWEYAFSAKMSRIMMGKPRPYDLDDAVSYIHAYICSHGNQPVETSTAHKWAACYKTPKITEVLRAEVNTAYKRKYGGRALI